MILSLKMDALYKCIDINFRSVLNGITSVYDQRIKQGVGQSIVQMEVLL
jgi:hypothetical protein